MGKCCGIMGSGMLLLVLSLLICFKVSDAAENLPGLEDDPKPLKFPFPRVIVLGPNESGKSSLANVLVGCEPNDQTCFPTCDGQDQCTNHTSAVGSPFLGRWGANFSGEITLVDSPGFDEDDDMYAEHLRDLKIMLKDILHAINLILICTDTEHDFSPQFFKMIQELESWFGVENLWNNARIEVTKWAYDEWSMGEREHAGIDEDTTLAHINDIIMSNTHLDHPLEGIFLDSFAVRHENDETQMKWFQGYAQTLWKAANSANNLTLHMMENSPKQVEEYNYENNSQDNNNEYDVAELYNKIENDGEEN